MHTPTARGMAECSARQAQAPPQGTGRVICYCSGYLVSEVTRETGRNPGRVGSGRSTELLVRGLFVEVLWAEVSGVDRVVQLWAWGKGCSALSVAEVTELAMPGRWRLVSWPCAGRGIRSEGSLVSLPALAKAPSSGSVVLSLGTGGHCPCLFPTVDT